MNEALWYLLMIPAAYLLGSLPSGVIVAKAAGGGRQRSHADG